eukprot:4672334-Pleurochrysis_carterae.AAC.1
MRMPIACAKRHAERPITSKGLCVPMCSTRNAPERARTAAEGGATRLVDGGRRLAGGAGPAARLDERDKDGLDVLARRLQEEAQGGT